MQTRGFLLVLILLTGSLVSPMGFSQAQVSSVPAVPTNLLASPASSSQINLSWNAPVNSTSTLVNGYKIEVRPGCTGSFNVLVANTTTATTFSSTGLVSGICYEYRVSAINQVGIVNPSNASLATTWSIPSSPLSLIANAVSSSQINLTWFAPASSGGTPVTGYKIERRDSCTGSFSVLVANTNNTNTAYSNTGLGNNTCYQYRIFAHNAVGTSLASNSASATTLQAPIPIHVPSAPTNLNVIALSKSSLKLTWSVPTDNGGASIIGYSIQRNGTTIVNNTRTTHTNYVDIDLLSNHQQTYRVAAWNSAGLGPYSNSTAGKTTNQTGTVIDVDNLGQMVSDFVHKYNALFKQQREETIKAIKECNNKVKNTSTENRKQVKEDCKKALKEIKEKYKDARKQFKLEFKEFRENAKFILNEAKKSHIVDKKEVKEFNHDLKDFAKEIKESKKELKKSKDKHDKENNN
jgi:hypothetical protein